MTHGAYKTIDVERRGQTEWITLNRPAQLNAITSTMTSELGERFTSLQDDHDTRVVVLRGAGRGFCAGLDLNAHAAGGEAPETGGGVQLPDIIRLMRRCPQPIVSLVHGPACGGGFAFALASDIRIAGASARMNDAFVTLGISGCELGVSYFLPRQVGMSVAAELMYTGRFIDAQRALQVGLVSRVVPDDQLEAAAEELVADLLRVAPMALRKTKETLRRALDVNDLDAVIEMELATQRECLQGPNFREAIQAFVEKRPPRFTSD